jgi:beta-glucosidase
MRSGTRFLVVIGALLVTACAAAQVDPPIAPPVAPAPAPQVTTDPNAWPAVRSRVALDPAMEARIDSILARMPLEEKVAQTIQPDISSVTPEDVRNY